MEALTPLERTVVDLARARDAELRRLAPDRRRGVVHTPVEIARFVARAAEDILRRELHVVRGLSDPALCIVDPACGPGVFIAAVEVLGGGGAREVVGLDCDEAASDAARAALRAHGSAARIERRNSLESLDVFRTEPQRVLVIGNPPWSGRTLSTGQPLIEQLLEDFRCDARGIRLPERKLGVLADEYVRFLRWGAELVRRTEYGGVLAFVTNGSFLDGPIHRAMRDRLLDWFDGIDIVDLGGNAMLKREGGPDENVFGVRTSVAITLAWRKTGSASKPRAHLRYARLRGRATEKLEQLAIGARDAFPWEQPPLWGPFHVFGSRPSVPGYFEFPSLAAVIPFHREGLQSNRDAIVIDRSPERLQERAHAFARGEARADLAGVERASRHFNPEVARRIVAAHLASLPIVPLAYRPFDDRFVLALAPICHRPRGDLQRSMCHSNSALLTVRKDRGEGGWFHFGVTRKLVDNCYLSTRSSCRTRAFPTHDDQGLLNYDSSPLTSWMERLGRPIEAGEFRAFAVAVLAAPSYSEKFSSVLKLDYPRLPPPPDGATFEDIVACGRSIEASFLDGPGEEPMQLGHQRINCAPARLLASIAAADRAIRPILELIS